MEKRYRDVRSVLERDIVLEAVLLDDGLQVLITGGDRPHIGAVSLGQTGGVRSLELPGHREQVIAAHCAEKLTSRLPCPVCVACGIHYDRLDARGIAQVVACASEMTDKLVNFCFSSGGFERIMETEEPSKDAQG
jgi:hypothetical protein